MTYNGVAMTSIGKQFTDNQTAGFIERYILVAPSTGANNVVVTFAASQQALIGASISAAGASQTLTDYTAVKAFGSSATASAVVTAPATTSLVTAAVCCGSPITSSAQTQRWLISASSSYGAGCGAGETTVGTGSNITMSFGVTSDWWGLVATEIKQASSGGGTTYNGSAALTEAATLGATAAYTALPTSAPSEASTLTAAPYLTISRTAALSEAASLSATGTVQSGLSVTMSEAATLAAAALQVSQVASAVSEASSLSAAPTLTARASASMSEASALTAGSTDTINASASLSEQSAFAASGFSTIGPAVALTEATSFNATAKGTALPATPMTEAATMSAVVINSTWSVSLNMSEAVSLAATPTSSTPLPAPAYIPPTPPNLNARNVWRAWIFDTRTGAFQTDLPLAATPTYSYGLNDGGGSGSVEVAIVGPDGFDKNLLDQYVENVGLRWSIGVSFNDQILQAGPILTESYTDPATYVTINFAGIWKIFSAWYVFNPAIASLSTPADPSANITYSGITARQLAKSLVRDGMLTFGQLPIDLPEDDPLTGTVSQTYYGYDLNLLSDALNNVVSMDGGPEIEFRPYWKDPLTTRWAMRTGSPRLGTIGAPWVFDYGSRGSLVALDKASDSSAGRFGWYVRGAGSQNSQVFGYSADMTLPKTGYPLLLGVDGNHTNETLVSNLNAFAAADTNTYKAPVRTYTGTIRLNGVDVNGQPTGSPTLNQLNVGDTITAHVEKHNRLPDGDYKWRVLSVTNNDTQTAKLALQPTS